MAATLTAVAAASAGRDAGRFSSPNLCCSLVLIHHCLIILEKQARQVQTGFIKTTGASDNFSSNLGIALSRDSMNYFLILRKSKDRLLFPGVTFVLYPWTFLKHTLKEH